MQRYPGAIEQAIRRPSDSDEKEVDAKSINLGLAREAWQLQRFKREVYRSQINMAVAVFNGSKYGFINYIFCAQISF